MASCSTNLLWILAFPKIQYLRPLFPLFIDDLILITSNSVHSFAYATISIPLVLILIPVMCTLASTVIVGPSIYTWTPTTNISSSWGFNNHVTIKTSFNFHSTDLGSTDCVSVRDSSANPPLRWQSISQPVFRAACKIPYLFRTGCFFTRAHFLPLCKVQTRSAFKKV